MNSNHASLPVKDRSSAEAMRVHILFVKRICKFRFIAVTIFHGTAKDVLMFLIRGRDDVHDISGINLPNRRHQGFDYFGEKGKSDHNQTGPRG